MSVQESDRAPSAKRQKFVELAEARTARAIKAIRMIGHLSNRRSYEYGDVDVRKIMTALAVEMEDVKTKMSVRTGEKKNEVDFRL